VYLAFNGGSPVIGTGPSWAAGTSGSIAAGSCARGTGAGGAALVRTQGIWTNAAAMSLIYNLGGGNITLAVPANQGIFLGSIFVDGTAGQVSAYRTWGQSRKFGVWNAYNKQPIYLVAGDPTASWSYSTGTWRAANGNSANSLTIFSGLPEDSYDLRYNTMTEISNQTMVTATGQVGLGFNSTTSPTGGSPQGSIAQITGTGADYVLIVPAVAQYFALPALGINVITALEITPSLGAGVHYFGSQSFMNLSAQWRG
jgi:hypothetical protein